MEKMKLLSFQAETPALALKKAQEQCGEDALVINTKQIRPKSAMTPSLYEVVVAIENEHKQDTYTKKVVEQPKTQPQQQQPQREKESDDVVFSISAVAKQMDAIDRLSEASKSVMAPIKK